MGGMVSNGLVVQIQRRADQEAFLRAFWEFRDSVRHLNRQLKCQKHGNRFENNFPYFDECECEAPAVFYPARKVLNQLDSQCLMRTSEISTLWNNIHHAMDTVWGMLNKFDRLRQENGPSFQVHYLQYNEHGAMDLFSWEQPSNRMFILYTICYLTFFPDSEGEKGILEHFETMENFKEFLEELKMAQFVKISPLLRIFFRTHDFGNRSKHFDPENDLENMIDFFFKRAYFQQISDTSFNVYTAAVVYGNSMFLRNFGEKRHRETEQLEKRKEQKKVKSFVTSINNRHARKVADMTANVTNAVIDQAYGLDTVEQKSAKEKQTALATGATPNFHATQHSLEITNEKDIDIEQGLQTDRTDGTQDDNILENAITKLAPTKNFLGKMLDKISSRLEVKDRFDSDYRSAIDKSLICLCLQTSMNVALLMLNPDTSDWGDDDAETPIIFKHIINCTIIVFTFYYIVTTSISGFFIHTPTLFVEMKSRMSKFLVLADFFVNTLLATSLILSTAVILKRSTATVEDIVLNSTAIYFISDLDDMMLGSVDEEILEERVLFTYIYHLMKASGKSDKGAVIQFLRQERWWLLIQSNISLLVLGYAFYTYFGTTFPHLFTYSTR